MARLLSAPLACRMVGPVDAPPVVLLHAIATTSAMWEPQFPLWSRHFRIIAFDLPGHGDSAVPQAMPGIAAMADAVADSCASLGIDRAAFVGLSLGSMVAQRLAAERPALVRAAVLSNGVCAVPAAGAELWRARADAAESGGMAPQVQETLERWLTPEFRAAAPLTTAEIGELVRATPASGFAFAARAIAGLDQRDLATHIACPTLVIAGESDVATPPPAVRVLADAVPGARFELLAGPHLLNVEQPVLFAEIAGRFLLDHCA